MAGSRKMPLKGGIRAVLGNTTLIPKKYIDQEPPYLMRQICVLQWEAIKTKNSGAKHQ